MKTTAIHRYFAGLSRNTFLLALASLFADISTEMLYPILPIFLTDTLRASGSVVGLIEGIAGATQNVVQGFSGALSDKLQGRKPLALAGYLLAAIAKPLMGIATAWPELAGGRVLDRLGAGARSAPRDALIAASVDAAHRGKAFGLEGLGDNAGAFLGPLLAVLLLMIWHLDIRLIFYLAVVPGLLAFAMVLFVEERPMKAKAKAKIEVSFERFTRPYWKYLLATALFGIGNSSNAFLILQTQDIGASLTTTILVYAGFNLVAALVSYPAGLLSDSFGRRNIVILALTIFLVAYLGFALSRNIVLIAVLFVFYGLYQGIFRSVGKALATDLVPERLQASGIGWYNTVIGLSGLAASLAAGWLWDRVGHAAVFLFGAIFAVIGGIALLALVPADREHKAS
jgi:MFS family permease